VEKIFKAQKTQSQIDNPRWTIYVMVVFMAVCAAIYRENIHSSTIVIAFIMLAILAFKQKNDTYLLFNDEGIVFHSGRAVFWTIQKNNIKNIEHKPTHIGKLQPNITLGTVLFNCNDGDSYSILTCYFSEEQVREMQKVVEQIKNE